MGAIPAECRARFSQDQPSRFSGAIQAGAATKEVVVQVLLTGQCIKHEIYGLGVITDADSERTTIDFDAHGTKKFVTTLMTAELIGDAPTKPVRPKRRSRRAVAAVAAAART
jgi:hypothetical protein